MPDQKSQISPEVSSDEDPLIQNLASDFTPEVEDKKGVKAIPLIGETVDNFIPESDDSKKDGVLDDVPILGDVTKELTPETQSEEGVEAIPFLGEINKNLNEKTEKEGKSEAHPVGDLFLENKSETSEKKGKSFENMTLNEAINNSTKPEDLTENTNVIPIESTPIDKDEDTASPLPIEDSIPKDLKMDLSPENESPKNELFKNESHKSESPKSESHHSTLSSLFDNSSHSHDIHSDDSSFPLFDTNHSVISEYEAGTEVAVHLPEHHSMKNDSMADKIVSKHIEDSSESSSDMDSGVSKLELTNVEHTSDEQHTTFQNADANADSSFLGATANTTGMATSLDTKTVNTEVNKIKFQHARSGMMRFGSLMILIWAFLQL